MVSESCCGVCSQLLSQLGVSEVLASDTSNITQPIVACTLPSSLPTPVMDSMIDFFSSELRIVVQKLCLESQHAATGMPMPPTTPNDRQNKLFSCHPQSISIFLMNFASRLTVWASALYGTFVLLADIVNCSETARSYICQVMVPVVQNKRASPMYYLVISASITAKFLRNRAAFKVESTQIRNHHQVDDPESLSTPGGTKPQINTSQWHPSVIGQRKRKI